MANDIDMWQDIESCIGRQTDKVKEALLMECYKYTFIEPDEYLSISNKNLFIQKYGYWGNWY